MHESGLRVRVYPVLVEAIEAGVRYGWRRAHKHEESPDERTIMEAIESAVLNEMCERFDLIDGEDRSLT